MPRYESTFRNLVSYRTLIALLLLIAGLAGAQTPIGSADKLRVELKPTEPVSGSSAAKDTANNSEAEPAPGANSVRSEAGLMNAKVDTPKSQAMTSAEPVAAPIPAQCKRVISADVQALAQPIMLNRLGAAIPNGLIFALTKDTAVVNKQVQLEPYKRPRPLVLRANVGDCLTITLTNSIPEKTFKNTIVGSATTDTTRVSLHIQGMQWVNGPQDDGSVVGVNAHSLASLPPSTVRFPQTRDYTLYAKEEGTFLLYTMGDTSSNGTQPGRGLFGDLNDQT